MTHDRGSEEAAPGVNNRKKNEEEKRKRIKPMKNTLVPIALAFTLAAAAPVAFAGSATNPLTLSATVINNCSITTTPVAFGNYDPLSASPNQASGTVVIACTKNAAPSIW